MDIVLIDKCSRHCCSGGSNFDFQIGKSLFHQILTKKSRRKRNISQVTIIPNKLIVCRTFQNLSTNSFILYSTKKYAAVEISRHVCEKHCNHSKIIVWLKSKWQNESFFNKSLGDCGKGKDDMQVKVPLQLLGSSTRSQTKAQVAKSRSLPWGITSGPPRPWGERELGNISAQVLAPPKRIGILSLLQMQHSNSATQCRPLQFTFEISEYLIFYLEKCSQF